MFKNPLTVTLVMCCASLAFAGGYAAYEEVPYVRPATDLAYDIDQYEAENHTVFDLLVVVDNGDMWTVAYCLAYTWCVENPNIHPGTFWDHPNGRHNQPDPAQFPDYGLLQYETFYTCPEEYPNPDLDPSHNATTGWGPIQSGPHFYEREWYVCPELPNADGGRFILARFNLMIDCSLCVCPAGECYDYEPFPGAPVCAYFRIEGDYYFWLSGGEPWPFRIDIPICWYVPDCPGDVDADGDTDLSDLAELLASYGKCPGDDGYNPACNLYENEPPDGCIDLSDLAFLLANYGCGT